MEAYIGRESKQILFIKNSIQEIHTRNRNINVCLNLGRWCYRTAYQIGGVLLFNGTGLAWDNVFKF